MRIDNPTSQERRAVAITSGLALLLLSVSLLAQDADPVNAAEVSRAQYSSLVTDREPVDSLTTTTTDIGKLYFFTEMNNMAGKVVIHRWRYFEETIMEVPFSIKGPRWRVNSYKNIKPSMAGEWSVELVDEQGNHYGEHAILVAESGEEKTAPAEPATTADLAISETENSKQGNQPVSTTKPSTSNQSAKGFERIMTLFPDTNYVLVNDSLANEICPPGGAFKWQQSANRIWTLDMGARQHIRVHAADEDAVALRPDPDFAIPGSNCLMYSGHRFNAADAELVTELQTDCEGESNDIFSARSLHRHDNLVDLTIYGEQLAVCRYRIN